jgi:hypothetical protein
MHRTCLKNFLQKAHTGLKIYGGGINPKKTRFFRISEFYIFCFLKLRLLTFIFRVNTDIEIDVDGTREKLQRIQGVEIPWCGYYIDTLSLEVSYCKILDI